MRLSPSRLNGLFNGFAQRIAWRRSHECPCRDPRSGAADRNCPLCGGVGHTWDDPIEGLAAISGQKVQQNWAKLGMWQDGDQVMSLPSDSPLYHAGKWDRFDMLDSTAPFSIVLQPGRALIMKPVSIDTAFYLAGGARVYLEPPEVDEGGVLVWLEQAPPSDAQVTLSGRKVPVYSVLSEFPQDRAHHRGLPLPRRVVARVFDLAGR